MASLAFVDRAAAAVSAFFAVVSLLNCGFYLVARLKGARHLAERRGLASMWWALGGWCWFLLGVLLRFGRF